MQEEIENKSVTLIINSSKLTARTLATAFMKFLRYSKGKLKEHHDVKPQGKQTVKELIAQNQGVEKTELADKAEVKTFDHIAKQYGVDYAIKKGVSPEGKQRYMLFFKARDRSAIDQAMSALTAEGAEFSVTADGVKVDLANVQVDSETAMAQIEAALGMETGTLSGAGISVESGATVTIPSDLVQVDTSGIEAAVEQSTASGSEDTTVEKQVNVTTTAGSTDTTPVEQAAQAALSSESSTTDTTMTTNVTVEAGSTDATPAATSAQTELDNTFSNTMQTNGSADVTIEKASDNIAAVYSQVGSELQAAFNSPYSARASVNVTVDYHITNPTASLSTHSNGSSVSVSIAGHANGGEVGLHGAELSWLGEEGKEYVIPTVPGRRGRGIALWQQAGEDLGVLDSNGEIAAHANGGIVGPGGEELASNAILPMAAQPQDENKSVWSVTGQELTGGTSEDNSEGQKAVSVNAAVQGQQGNNTFEINVDMNPVIKIEGGNMDEEKVFEVMKNRIREMADDLGDEIAERMSKIFANMPLVQEA